MSLSDPKQHEKQKAWIKYSDLGYLFALSIVLPGGVGYWLDTTFSTLPLFLILGGLLGMVSAFFTVYRVAFPSKNDEVQTRE